jgi:hypothetical protein
MTPTTRRRLVLYVLPLTAWLVGAGLLLSLRPDLPDPVAVHFGLSGVADVFDHPTSAITLLIALTALVGGLMLAIAHFLGRQISGGRLLAALPLGMVVFMGTIGWGVLMPQRGLADTRGLTLPGWVIPTTLGAAFAAFALAWWLHPAPEPAAAATTTPSAGAPRTDLGDTTPVWRGRTPFGKGLAGVMGLVAAATLVAWILTGTAHHLLLLPALIFPVLLAGFRFDLIVGPANVIVRGVFGWPRLSIPLDTLTEARVETVQPWRYGGWGWRMLPGRLAVLTRAGEAVMLDRSDGLKLLVTVDDAAEAAGVVNSLLDRRADRGA